MPWWLFTLVLAGGLYHQACSQTHCNYSAKNCSWSSEGSDVFLGNSFRDAYHTEPGKKGNICGHLKQKSSKLLEPGFLDGYLGDEGPGHILVKEEWLHLGHLLHFLLSILQTLDSVKTVISCKVLLVVLQWVCYKEVWSPMQDFLNIDTLPWKP